MGIYLDLWCPIPLDFLVLWNEKVLITLLNREAIWKGIAAGNFLEHTEFLGNIYGTSKTAVNTAVINNRICAMDLNINGVRSLKNTYLMHYLGI